MSTVSENSQPRVAVIMGIGSDCETIRHASVILTELAVPHECRIVSAHRTPDFLFEYVEMAKARGMQVIIAGAGGAAHLPGMAVAKTTLPVLGVPGRSRTLQGFDSLLSIVQMPKGIPVATHAIGEEGVINAAWQASAILAISDEGIQQRLKVYYAQQNSSAQKETT
jgi:5-(carboxyamino)imidazole ribonucleotide mutase